MEELLREGLLRINGSGEGRPPLFTAEEIAERLLKLQKYIEEIELFNPAYGLVKVDSRRELVVKHIMDSLAPLPLIKDILNSRNGAGEKVKAADVGSGAGLPGIPLAIMLPDISFTLIERMGRRAGFLRNSAAVLELSNVEIEERDMERVSPRQFTLITFRAFRPLEAPILKGLFRLLEPGGFLAAYKGREEKIREEMGAAEKLSGGWESCPVEVPFLDEERHLVIIRPHGERRP